jgi:aldehyde dehydrogenase (NAD+)
MSICLREIPPENAKVNPVAVWSWNTFIALVCGDTVIWKPSSKAALTAIATMKIVWPVLRNNGLSDGILNLVIGDRKSVGEKLIHDRRVPLISATAASAWGSMLPEPLHPV